MPEEDDDWTPDKERDEDSAKLTREAIELQKEGLKYLKSLRDDRPAVVGRTCPLPILKAVTLQVKRITNGWLLLKGQDQHGYPSEIAEETYFKTTDELVAGVDQLVRLFAAGAHVGAPEVPPLHFPVEGPETPPGVGSDVPEGT